VTAPRLHRPRLYLITPRLRDTETFAREVTAAVAAGDVAALLLRLEAADERTLTNRAKALAPAVQRHDVAFVLDGDPQIAVRAGADGAHLTGIAALTDGIEMLRPDRIAGAGGLRSRHDAMLAAESGADYLMFGEVDHGGWRPPFPAIAERLTWWSELFEPPCVGYAASLDEVAAIADAGADFVALGEWIWTQMPGPAAAVAEAASRIAKATPSAAKPSGRSSGRDA
jgi:thiamine-phosphate pyrophosphorylase